jgi:hypothetical protein
MYNKKYLYKGVCKMSVDLEKYGEIMKSIAKYCIEHNFEVSMETPEDAPQGSIDHHIKNINKPNNSLIIQERRTAKEFISSDIGKSTLTMDLKFSFIFSSEADSEFITKTFADIETLFKPYGTGGILQ